MAHTRTRGHGWAVLPVWLLAAGLAAVGALAGGGAARAAECQARAPRTCWAPPTTRPVPGGTTTATPAWPWPMPTPRPPVTTPVTPPPVTGPPAVAPAGRPAAGLAAPA